MRKDTATMINNFVWQKYKQQHPKHLNRGKHKVVEDYVNCALELLFYMKLFEGFIYYTKWENGYKTFHLL